MEQGRPVGAGRRRPHLDHHKRVWRYNATDEHKGRAIASVLLGPKTGREESTGGEHGQLAAQSQDNLLLQCGRPRLTHRVGLPAEVWRYCELSVVRRRLHHDRLL